MKDIISRIRPDTRQKYSTKIGLRRRTLKEPCNTEKLVPIKKYLENVGKGETKYNIDDMREVMTVT